MEERLAEIEQPAGPPLVRAADAAKIDDHRRRTYQSYEHFLTTRLTKLDMERADRWQRDYADVDAYRVSVEPMRGRLKAMLGFWIEVEDRAPVTVLDEDVVLEEEDFIARRFRIEVLPGLETYGLELIPNSPGPHAGLLAQHGYGGTPESVCGLVEDANLEDYTYRSLGVRAVRRGFHVVAIHHATGYGPKKNGQVGHPGFPEMPHQYGKNRLHRLAVMGRGTLFGLDMMASSRGVDLLGSREGVDADRIGMYGLSQGGQSALFLPALDTRIKASVSSAFFNTRLTKLVGPCRALCYLDSHEEDKFFGEVVSHFADPDIVSLHVPRAFAVEAGLKDGAVDFEASKEAFGFAAEHYAKLGLAERIEFIAHAEGHVSATARAFEFLMEHV